MNEENRTDEVLTEEKSEYIPSPRWKRVLAWVLFAVVLLGIAFWLLGIARPEWPDVVRHWFVG